MVIYHKLIRKGLKFFEEKRIVNDLGSGEAGRSQNPNDYIGQKIEDTEWVCTDADLMCFTFRKRLTILDAIKAMRKK